METTPEPTYMILGGDGQQYGPVTAQQFRDWARDGRVNGQTQVFPTGGSAWMAASAVSELGVAVASTAPSPTAMPATARDPELEKEVKNGVSWLYWIAGLSLVNSVAAMAGSDWRFIIGLGITQFIDAIATGAGNGGKIIAFALDLVAAGLLVLLGYFANKLHGWAAIVGMILLLLDGLLVALTAFGTGEGSLWISVAFHAWAIFRIFKGFQASRQLRA